MYKRQPYASPDRAGECGAEAIAPITAPRVTQTSPNTVIAVSYTHLRAHETVLDLVCRLLLEKEHQNNIKLTEVVQAYYTAGATNE